MNLRGVWWSMFLLLCCQRTAAEPPPPDWRVARVEASVGAHKPLLVLLHGYGATEQDLLPIGAALGDRYEVWALRAPIELERGGAAWYPITFGPDGARSTDPKGLEQARQGLARWLRARAPRPVSLLGFSQGAILSLSIAASEPALVREVVAIAGRLPTEVSVKPGPGPRVLVLHGDRDPIISPVEAGLAADRFAAAGRGLTVERFDAAHTISSPMRARLESWLRAPHDAR